MSDDGIQIAKNYSYSLSLQVISLLTPLVTTPYISRVLGAVNIGIYGFSSSIRSYFTNFGGLGFPLYGQRETARCSNDIEKRSQVFFEVFAGQAILLGIALAIYALCTAFVFTENQAIYMAQMLGILGSQLETAWFYQGMEEFRVTAMRGYAVKLLSVVGLFLFVKSPDDLLLYTIIMMVPNVISNGILLAGVRKYVKRSAKLTFRGIFRHLKPAFILGVPFYATTIYWVVDKTLLAMLSRQYAEVGYYEQAEKIVTFAMAIVTSLGTVFLPRLVQETEHGAKDNIRKYMQHGLGFVVLLAMPIMTGLIVMSSSIVPWFFGPGYEKDVILLRILAPLALVMGLSSFIGNQYLVAAGREKTLTVTVIACVLLNILFDVLLIPRYACYGAAMATLISEIVKLIMQAYAAREVLALKKLAAGAATYVLFSLVMSAVVVMLKGMFFAASTMVNSLILIMAGAGTYFLLLVVSKNYYLYKVFSYIRNKLISEKGMYH